MFKVLLKILILVLIPCFEASRLIVQPRIVGGLVLKDDESIPFQVSLQYRRSNRHTCGGSILNQKYVVTAAHCVTSLDDAEANDFSVRVGSNVLETGGTVHLVKNFTVYKPYILNLNDVALIELMTPIQYNNKVKPIKISSTEVPVGADVQVSGWGKTSTNGKRSEILKKNTLKVMSQSDCKRRTKLDFPQIICLDHPVGQGVCQGDSGGPAVYNRELVGLASFVKNGCGGKHPDIYVRISKFKNWINSNMN